MIPTDPVMLLSFVNMKLRDEYESLDELCKSLDINRKELETKLLSINYTYDESQNKFV